MSNRWQDITHTVGHMATSARQNTAAFKFAAATVSSFALVFSRCWVASQSAQKAKGTDKEAFAQGAEAQTMLREGGAFFTSYGVVNVLNGLLSKGSELAFNIRTEQVGQLGLVGGLKQLGAVMLGFQKDIPPPPVVLTGETRLLPGEGGVRFTNILTKVAHALAGKELAGLSPEQVALKGFEKWQAFIPITAASAVGIVLSGWVLERIALLKGPQLVAYMTHRGEPSSAASPGLTLKATLLGPTPHMAPPLQLASLAPTVVERPTGSVGSTVAAMPPTYKALRLAAPSTAFTNPLSM